MGNSLELNCKRLTADIAKEQRLHPDAELTISKYGTRIKIKFIEGTFDTKILEKYAFTHNFKPVKNTDITVVSGKRYVQFFCSPIRRKPLICIGVLLLIVMLIITYFLLKFFFNV